MSDWWLGALVLVVAGTVGFVVHHARGRHLKPRTVKSLAGLCGLGLILLLWSDWPSEQLSNFWAGHTILAGILTTVLLVGVVFLLFEDSEMRQQQALDDGLASAGLGGIVDHLVDAEVALSLMSYDSPPSAHGWSGWDADDKPLRWLRHGRERLNHDNGHVSATDPRGAAPLVPDVEPRAWRVKLVDQTIRRLLAALRDWTPLIGTSKNGVQALLVVSEIRNDLMKSQANLMQTAGEDTSGTDVDLVHLRRRLRILALFCECISGANPPRAEVLQTIAPPPPAKSDGDWQTSAGTGAISFSPDWQNRMGEVIRQLTTQPRGGIGHVRD